MTLPNWESAAHLSDVMVFFWALHAFLISGTIFFVTNTFRK